MMRHMASISPNDRIFEASGRRRAHLLAGVVLFCRLRSSSCWIAMVTIPAPADAAFSSADVVGLAALQTQPTSLAMTTTAPNESPMSVQIFVHVVDA
ncbi:MAG TPA: hypothetical protein VGY54_15375, partial [Polyangiaceae bacterium]|nr:hypothetical protein [Polyangiaceae bacterium]